MSSDSMRREVCELANELAKKRGGKPHQYMGEAWETVRQRKGLDIKRKPIKRKSALSDSSFDSDNDDTDRFSHFRRGGGIKDKLRDKTRETVKSTARSLNFTQAPKDSPPDFFKAISRKPDPIPKLPESIKKMFKIW